MKEIVISIEQESRKKIAMIIENGNLIEKYEESEETNRLEGNIYLGKIQNVLQGMQAAFVNIGENRNTFIHIKDILPKQDAKINGTEQLVQQHNIKEVAKIGMPILVQVKRDSTHKKGARVSSHLNIPGRFCVLMPNTNFITVSQKIEKEEERERLIKIVKQHLPTHFGIIIRTAAKGKSEQELIDDMKSVQKQWEEIKRQVEQAKEVPCKIYQSSGMIEKILVDFIDQDIHRVLVNEEEQYRIIKGRLEKMGAKVDLVLKDKESLLEMYDLDQQLERMENRKIWLKCGGFITIDKTEALTAIDVNSGKYIGSSNLEQTVYLVNKEASIEIAKQLRLRDIGGIIVIDYIDMKDSEHKEKIVDILRESLKKDRSKTQVIGFT